MKYIIVITERKIELNNEELAKVLESIQYRTIEGKEQLMFILDGCLSLLNKEMAEGRIQTLRDLSIRMIVNVNRDNLFVMRCFPVRKGLPLLSHPDLKGWDLEAEKGEPTPRERELEILEQGEGELIINEMEEVKDYLQSVSERMEEDTNAMELRFAALDIVITAIKRLLNRKD